MQTARGLLYFQKTTLPEKNVNYLDVGGCEPKTASTHKSRKPLRKLLCDRAERNIYLFLPSRVSDAWPRTQTGGGGGGSADDPVLLGC